LALGAVSTRKKVLCLVAVLGALTVACFAAVIFVALRPAQMPSPLLSVTFVSYTNAPDGQSYAQFALSNLPSSRILVLQPMPVVRTNGQWSAGSLTGRPFVLGGRQQSVISVPKPTGAEAWRLPVGHGPLPSLPALAACRVFRVLPWKPAGLTERLERASSIRITVMESDIRTD